MTPRAKAPQSNQASNPTRSGRDPRARIDFQRTPTPIPKSPRERKIFESSFPPFTNEDESGSALTRIAQRMKPRTKVGVADRNDFFSFSGFFVERKKTSGTKRTMRVNFTMTAESSAVDPISDAVAIT